MCAEAARAGCSQSPIANLISRLADHRIDSSMVLGFTHRLLSSSFSGLPYRILNINHKKELLRSLWVGLPHHRSTPADHWCRPKTGSILLPLPPLAGGGNPTQAQRPGEVGEAPHSLEGLPARKRPAQCARAGGEAENWRTLNSKS